MGIFLNTKSPFENYSELIREYYFVDKSEIIKSLNNKISTKSKYVCVTTPRRFGKSSVVDMLGAYYSKAVDSKEIFDKLNISNCDSYEENLNKYNVINISFNKIPDKNKTYDEYIDLVQSALIADIQNMYPDLKMERYHTISDMLYLTSDKFIFIFDEWDYIFSNKFFEESQNDFLEFIRQLLKDQPYVALAYMTGILPIKRYSSGSALNMFDEYTMLNDTSFGEFFGFTEEEVKNLCSRQSVVNFESVSDWYNGYLNEDGEKLYNPRSVVKSLQRGKCKSYWTNTGAMDEVAEYLKYNTLEIREDVIEMVSGGEIDIFIDEEFRAGRRNPRTKEEIYSAMIVLGFLSYHDGYLKIPNRELMKEFEKALRDESFGYVSARDIYRIEREEKTGKGYADFTFHPRRKSDKALIVELKKDENVDVALKQIKEKEYVQKFIPKAGNSQNENNEVLAVAICYNSKTKESWGYI